ncbi:hypothetical protein [Aidingimonas halophila]|uniref:Uncharacterized protein n=1 Tax=Aidingimonas halophila TaxID=574349 RepID=A0A1H3GYD3_9GAMM|nr:hypothetical protein [Aidingimonas halophila]GHC36111.1 hypothetical protein GCM10008094_31660 [Aidingimonas halophila]SDY07379.1 hypothetical protein SAMN05443545_11072 [Aidingimonas halophila]
MTILCEIPIIDIGYLTQKMERPSAGHFRPHGADGRHSDLPGPRRIDAEAGSIEYGIDVVSDM